jgi:hypothetical protein
MVREKAVRGHAFGHKGVAYYQETGEIKEGGNLTLFPRCPLCECVTAEPAISIRAQQVFYKETGEIKEGENYNSLPLRPLCETSLWDPLVLVQDQSTHPNFCSTNVFRVMDASSGQPEL